ncbi:MAG: ABC transporter permease subunit [Pseudomonadota bacterium]|nr:ABC transporter permease subunit [Pseudomonadota bacterium]
MDVRRVVWKIAGLLGTIALWDLNARLGFYRLVAPTLPGRFFPTAFSIADSALAAVGDVNYWGALSATVGRALVALAASVCIGTVAAFAVSQSRIVRDVVHWPLEWARQIPASALLPFAILLLGVGGAMKVAVATVAGALPMYVYASSAFAETDPTLSMTARAYRWQGVSGLVGVTIPAALPALFAGVRVVLSIILIVVVLSEMLVGSDGLGGRLVMLERSFAFAPMYAEVALLGIVGLLLSAATDLAGRRFIHWSPQGRGMVQDANDER